MKTYSTSSPNGPHETHELNVPEILKILFDQKNTSTSDKINESLCIQKYNKLSMKCDIYILFNVVMNEKVI